MKKVLSLQAFIRVRMCSTVVTENVRRLFTLCADFVLESLEIVMVRNGMQLLVGEP